MPGFNPEIGVYARHVTTNVLLLSVQIMKGLKLCLIQEVDEAVATMRQLPEQPLRKILREELHLRKKVILSKSEVKHIQIQHSEVVIEGTGGVQENVLASADEKEPAFGTGHSSAIWETNIEDNVNSRRSDNSDNSDDDISFVIV